MTGSVVVITGSPGSGKTTALVRHVDAALAELEPYEAHAFEIEDRDEQALVDELTRRRALGQFRLILT